MAQCRIGKLGGCITRRDQLNDERGCAARYENCDDRFASDLREEHRDREDDPQHHQQGNDPNGEQLSARPSTRGPSTVSSLHSNRKNIVALGNSTPARV
jgi:hypothetical protein